MSANDWDDEYCPDADNFDGCEHGKDFSEECQACEDDPLGCLYPGKCTMPGEHLISECCTAEMMEEIFAEQGIDQRKALLPRSGA